MTRWHPRRWRSRECRPARSSARTNRLRQKRLRAPARARSTHRRCRRTYELRWQHRSTMFRSSTYGDARCDRTLRGSREEGEGHAALQRRTAMNEQQNNRPVERDDAPPPGEEADEALEDAQLVEEV